MWNLPYSLPPAALAAALLLAQSAAAFDMQKTVDAPAPPSYPFRILDAYPGMTVAEAQAAVASRELELSETGGTLTLRSPSGASISVDMPVAFGTVGYGHPMHHRDSLDAHYVRGDLTSPASGSVISTISRTMHSPAAETPAFGAVLAQLVGLYGEPSFADGSYAIWKLDPQGNLLGDVSCSIHVSHEFRYLQPTNRDTNVACGVEFRVSRGTHATLNGEVGGLSFTLIDHELMRRDAIAASEQLDAAMAADHEASDLDL